MAVSKVRRRRSSIKIAGNSDPAQFCQVDAVNDGYMMDMYHSLFSNEELDQLPEKDDKDEGARDMENGGEKEDDGEGDKGERSSKQALFWDTEGLHHTMPVFAASQVFVPTGFDSIFCNVRVAGCLFYAVLFWIAC